MIKILYSPSHGSGWVTWASGPKKCLYFMLRYQPFISEIEENGEIRPEMEDPLWAQFENDWEKEGFDKEDLPYRGSLDQLDVYEVDQYQPFTIEEFDGCERIKYLEDAFCFNSK